ncbi:uncharacterized protein LOC126902327 isoform X17 [Daktulosphaira vitifoliae]|uniref:uncharacterized protein LOC126902327 isoform X17 n=1 Tax=Daktulosphaira vitifoliae TaxID=58002 RepID=UPI0021A9D1ED|nr:uncharacterized protein LOC126902327 isoform X17 [Daktulosphaira vitifoliae]
MIQMILLKFFIIFRTCYGTSDDLKKDLEKSWAEFDKQLKCDHLQYIGYNEGMEDDMDMHSKIKRQYLSSINNIRNWHGVEPLKQNNELDVFAQSYANYEARVERNVTFNSVFGLLLSSRPYLFSNDVGKKVPYELYRYFDDDDKPFDFEANEDEMIKTHLILWKCRSFFHNIIFHFTDIRGTCCKSDQNHRSTTSKDTFEILQCRNTRLITFNDLFYDKLSRI